MPQQGGARHPVAGLDGHLCADFHHTSRRDLEEVRCVIGVACDPNYAPTALLHNLKHNKILHEKNVILTVTTATTPRVPEKDRIQIDNVSEHFSRVTMKFGFMETPNVPKGLAIARKSGWNFDIMSTSFFVSRRSIKPAARSGMPLWQDKLFIGLARNANDATDFFQIPTGRVVEVGTQVTV